MGWKFWESPSSDGPATPISAVAFEQIVARLNMWSDLGAVTVPNGTRIIGHIPHVAPLAYLHEVYTGLKDEHIIDLESQVGRPIPEHHRTFLRLGNGMSLFMELSLYGLRLSYARDPESSRLPLHMKDSNIAERPTGARADAVFIGGYSFDGSKLFVVPEDPRVYHCPRREAKPLLNSWPNLESLLNTEIDRFETLFDRHGKLIHPDEPTMPARGTYW
jgi:hypothetical protein